VFIVSSATVIPADLVDLFEGGVSLLVGTRDASLVPEATRAVGAVVHPNRLRLTIFLPTEVSQRAENNLRDNGLIAVGFSSIIDHKTIQVKGRVVEIRPAAESEREIVGRYHVAIGEVLAMTAIPRHVVRRVNVWPSTAVTFEATDIFTQTPGPGAGERLKTAQ
jgi:hypothetical protein